ncbi:MAG TPA: TrmH family RNA methyltransferase [Sediminispirochaeta sp.]|nr:TrmH family RNA methyltransferase [Sediminispirochaeta sp.]
MITVRKLLALPPKTRYRKVISLLESWERSLAQGARWDKDHAGRIFRMLAESSADLPERERECAQRLYKSPSEGGDGDRLLRELQNLRYGLMELVGASPADWDLFDPGTGRLSRRDDRVLPLELYLDDIRSPFNLGSIFRSAEAFGVRKLLLSPHTARADHPRALRSSMGCVDVLPHRVVSVEELERISREQSMPLFALELGGERIEDFDFPEGGIAVLGSEELGVSPEVRRLAEASAGVVSIPLLGAKASLNVAVAAGILLERWVASIATSSRLVEP